MTLIRNFLSQQVWILEPEAVLLISAISNLKSSIRLAYQKYWEMTWLLNISTFTGRKYKGSLN